MEGLVLMKSTMAMDTKRKYKQKGLIAKGLVFPVKLYLLDDLIVSLSYHALVNNC